LQSRLVFLVLTVTATALAAIAAFAAQGAASTPALQPAPRSDPNSLLAHQQLLQKAHTGRIDLYFLGDSITRRWGATDYPQLLEHWNATFHGWNAGNFGWGGDKVANILWRIQNGELDGVQPRVIVLMAGTNDVGNQPPPEGVEPAAVRIASGIEVLLSAVRARAPQATVILMGILPRGDNPAVMPVIDGINMRIERLADGRRVRYLNINRQLTAADGSLLPGMMMTEQLHPALPGYRIWAAALEPLLTQLLGPRAAEDHAPPPTGDPAARH
jgi:lysophospholipase L1-like esterase